MFIIIYHHTLVYSGSLFKMFNELSEAYQVNSQFFVMSFNSIAMLA